MYERKLIGFEEAKGAIDTMVQEVRSKPDRYWQEACFAIVDYAGLLVLFARMDRGGKQGVDMAIRKAYTAASWGRSTSAFGKMIRAKDWLSGEYNFGPDYTIVPGGMAILEPDGKKERFSTPYCVGAVGVACAGSAEVDDAVAAVGARYIENALWPGSADVTSLAETFYDKPYKPVKL